MHSPMRFGLIGVGGIAQSYIQAFDYLPAARLSAVVDVRKEAAEATGERLRCAYYTDYKEMLAQPDLIDAVVICTPPNTHEMVAVDCLDAGKHVLCEKPFTLSSASAKVMIDAAKKAECIITMASKFRYVEDVIKAKSLVASGMFGDVILFENAFTGKVDMTNRWNSKPAVSGGGVLIDNGTHSIDLCRYFLGPMKDVHVVEGKRLQTVDVEDTVRMFAHSASGVLASIDLSWSIDKNLEDYIRIYGSLGTLAIGWKESKYKLHNGSDWVIFGKGYNKVLAFRDSVTNFVKGIRGEEPLRITFEDALASVRTIETAYQSLQGTRWDVVSDSKF